MNILVVQESDWIKRNPHQQHHLMERLSLKGHKVKVIDYPIDWCKGRYKRRNVVENYHKIHAEASVDVISPSILKVPILVYPSLILSHRREIKRQIKEFKPDVIVGFGIINTYFASRTAKKEGIPFIYYWIDVLHRLIPEKGFHALGEHLERATIQNSTEVLTINHKLEEFVKGLGAINTRVIGAGIDLEKFNPDLEGTSIRQQYSITEDDKVLFFMGFLYQFAGLKEVALEFKKDKYKNLKLLIVGDGDAYSDLQNIVEEHDLSGNVILVGHKPYNEIPEFLAASDICILPAYPDEEIMQDIVPIKIYEYMAMGKPVITTRLPGVVKEFGEDNGISYVEKPSDVLVKASDIDVIIEGGKARRFAEDNDWNKITDEFESTLNGVVRIE
ncbi:glycosyltransferase [Methanobacterium paludis]|uniref:Glycosyl transferase group 1 n=1 Tax=Methanobacterium paludis (strain DSM 25820 / JCM 18151 / SWAN1) TaxID=868131 RepID=F6D716_METPW|nr:glycosyltransferase [Methanobacterium paludis]AEG18383.1 glycosyl transferase group 1 [Methanobacterium paludis]